MPSTCRISRTIEQIAEPYIMDSVFNCIDPSLIPLFDFAAMADDASLLINNPVGLCTEVLRATIEWNEVTDMDLSTRIQVSDATMVK